MTTIYLLQTLVPAGLILWIAVAAARSMLGFYTQVIATFILIGTLVFIGIWIIPPWCTPYVLAALLFLAVLFRLRRRPGFISVLPPSIRTWAVALLFLTLAIYSLTQLATALHGRIPPTDSIDLSYPLRKGTYLVVSGGNASTINSHFMTLDESVPRFQRWRGSIGCGIKL